jgi:hypothetical protein
MMNANIQIDHGGMDGGDDNSPSTLSFLPERSIVGATGGSGKLAMIGVFEELVRQAAGGRSSL